MRLRASLGILFVCAATSVTVAACSGAASSGLFDGPGETTSGDAGQTTSGDDTNGPTHDAGTTPTPSHDAGAAHDAAPTTGIDSAIPETDSAPPPPAVTIDCDVSSNIKTCDATTQVCCRVPSNNGQGNTNATYSCTPASGCTQVSALPIPCDNADDCTAQGYAGGTVCCVTEDTNSGVAVSVACVNASDCAAQTQTWLCNGTNACPNGETCGLSTTTIPGYNICRK